MIYRRLFGVPSWSPRSPFAELDQMRQQMNRLWEGVTGESIRSRSAGVFPLVNLTEDRDNYFIRAELPGVKNDALDIQVDANTVSLSGERKIDVEGEGVKYHRREREAGKFSRLVSLPGEIDPDKVSA
ncbi:MAG: Hsp20/alpha crystallin family protein, partial [Desulfobacterales bacterium]